MYPVDHGSAIDAGIIYGLDRIHKDKGESKTSIYLTIGIPTLLVIALLVVVGRAAIPLLRRRRVYVPMGREWRVLLRKHATFSEKTTGYPVDVQFHYHADPTDENLKKLREMYDLEVVAGKGAEVEQIINLMNWVYLLAEHANEPEIPEVRNALTLIQLAKEQKMATTCYLKTIILNEVYLSMGFYSRHTHLLPHSKEEQESHFITSVYPRSLGTWILMDPDFGVYVTDGKGNLLGVREVRQRLIAGKRIKTLRPAKSAIENAQTDVSSFVMGVNYPWILSEFVFKIRCPKTSMFDQESVPARDYYELIPDGYREELLQEPYVGKRGGKIYYINDEDLLWPPPTGFSH